MMKWFKKLILVRLLILVISLKEADYNTKFVDIEKKIPDHDKYITTEEFNKLRTENFAERLKQAKLSMKDDIADFVKKDIL